MVRQAELQRLEAAQATAALKAATAERSGTSNQDTALNYSLQNEIHKLNAALLANAKGTLPINIGSAEKNSKCTVICTFVDGMFWETIPVLRLHMDCSFNGFSMAGMAS